jgi:ketosteroid isomerase-like protein
MRRRRTVKLSRARLLDALTPPRFARMVDAEIAGLEAELRAAQLNADVGALDRLIDDDLLFVGPDGAFATKADDLAAYRDGVMRVTHHEPQELRVRRVGAHAAVVALSARMSGSYGGAPFSGTARYIRVWSRDSGQWRIVAGQVSVWP